MCETITLLTSSSLNGAPEIFLRDHLNVADQHAAKKHVLLSKCRLSNVILPSTSIFPPCIRPSRSLLAHHGLDFEKVASPQRKGIARTHH